MLFRSSNLLRPPPAPGARLIAVSVHDQAGDAPNPDALADAMTQLAGRWSPGFPWQAMATLEDVVVHPWAQFAVHPGVREALPDTASGLENVFLAGDMTMHPSIEGAVASGERAAGVVDGYLGRQASGGH